MESTTEEHGQDVEQRKRTDSQPADDKKERYVDKFSHQRMFPGDVVQHRKQHVRNRYSKERNLEQLQARQAQDQTA